MFSHKVSRWNGEYVFLSLKDLIKLSSHKDQEVVGVGAKFIYFYTRIFLRSCL